MRAFMTGYTNSAIIEVLTPIWQRVLQRSPINMDDDFFDLGGNSALAVELLAEISQATGRNLRPAVICQAPTIRALAAVVQRPLAPAPSPLVLLKTGAEKPPIFITHGVGGSVIDFVPLARRIQGKHQIYGIQARGTDGGEEPFERVEDMAQYYLDAIKPIQPRGPYFLIGYSLGGQVMLEMAQRLSASGNKVSLLVMLDSYPPSHHLSRSQQVGWFVRRARVRLSTLKKLSVREAISRLTHRIGSRARAPVGAHFTPDSRRSLESATLAWARYRPRFYGGKIEFVRSEAATYFPANPAAVWGKVAAEFEFETVPGDHVGMVTTHVDSLASTLSRRLKEALRREHALLGMDDPRSQMQPGA
jgi:thioesterase domain-containing protein/acyl carrier protein